MLLLDHPIKAGNPQVSFSKKRTTQVKNRIFDVLLIGSPNDFLQLTRNSYYFLFYRNHNFIVASNL